jgi:hypothetical protein
MTLGIVLGKLSPDPTSHDFVTLLESCQPLCMDQATRTMLLMSMPSMYDIDIATI